jgi:proteasome lid subunit RPN8/RPN11
MKDRYRYRPLPRDTALNGHHLVITADVLESVARLLPKRVRGRDHENVLYLAGVIDGATRHAFVALAPKATTTPGSYMTERDSHAEVIWELSNSDLVVVAQVHCHPGVAVYHSDADDDLAFVKGEGFWSIVVPHYGRRGMTPLSACGFHCYSNGAFRLLERAAAETRITVVGTRIDLRRGA